MVLVVPRITVAPYHPPRPQRTRWNGPGTPRSTQYVCYQPEAKGGHAKHVETGQFTPPKPHSSEAIDSQNQSLRVRAEGHDQVIKKFLRSRRRGPGWRRRLPCARLARRTPPNPPRGDDARTPPQQAVYMGATQEWSDSSTQGHTLWLPKFKTDSEVWYIVKGSKWVCIDVLDAVGAT